MTMFFPTQLYYDLLIIDPYKKLQWQPSIRNKFLFSTFSFTYYMEWNRVIDAVCSLWSFFVLFWFGFFGNTGAWTQGLMLARQALSLQSLHQPLFEAFWGQLISLMISFLQMCEEWQSLSSHSHRLHFPSLLMWQRIQDWG
jgi:hypothetical protein